MQGENFLSQILQPHQAASTRTNSGLSPNLSRPCISEILRHYAHNILLKRWSLSAVLQSNKARNWRKSCRKITNRCQIANVEFYELNRTCLINISALLWHWSTPHGNDKQSSPMYEQTEQGKQKRVNQTYRWEFARVGTYIVRMIILNPW